MAKDALLEGEFNEEGYSPSVGVKGRANVLITGGVGQVGQVVLERSFNGEDFYPLTSSAHRVAENTPLNSAIEEHENNVYYRFFCSEFLGGPIKYRLGKASVVR